MSSYCRIAVGYYPTARSSSPSSLCGPTVTAAVSCCVSEKNHGNCSMQRRLNASCFSVVGFSLMPPMVMSMSQPPPVTRHVMSHFPVASPSNGVARAGQSPVSVMSAHSVVVQPASKSPRPREYQAGHWTERQRHNQGGDEDDYHRRWAVL